MNEPYYPAGTDLTYANISHEAERDLFLQARAGDGEAKEFLMRACDPIVTPSIVLALCLAVIAPPLMASSLCQ